MQLPTQYIKKDSKIKVNSYCPISILPISKIYEKLIHAKIMSFFTKNKTINTNLVFKKVNLLSIQSWIFMKHFKITRKERKSMLHSLRFCKGLWHSKSWDLINKVEILWSIMNSMEYYEYYGGIAHEFEWTVTMCQN